MCLNEYMKYHIFERHERYEFTIDHRSYTQNLSSCFVQA